MLESPSQKLLCPDKYTHLVHGRVAAETGCGDETVFTHHLWRRREERGDISGEVIGNDY